MRESLLARTAQCRAFRQEEVSGEVLDFVIAAVGPSLLLQCLLLDLDHQSLERFVTFLFIPAAVCNLTAHFV